MGTLTYKNLPSLNSSVPINPLNIKSKNHVSLTLDRRKPWQGDNTFILVNFKLNLIDSAKVRISRTVQNKEYHGREKLCTPSVV